MTYVTRQVIERLLAPAATPRQFGAVAGSASGGRYRVLLDTGQTLTVDGEAGWLAGDAVIIQSGRIVGAGVRPAIIRSFRV